MSGSEKTEALAKRVAESVTRELSEAFEEVRQDRKSLSVLREKVCSLGDELGIVAGSLIENVPEQAIAKISALSARVAELEKELAESLEIRCQLRLENKRLKSAVLAQPGDVLLRPDGEPRDRIRKGDIRQCEDGSFICADREYVRMSPTQLYRRIPVPAVDTEQQRTIANAESEKGGA